MSKKNMPRFIKRPIVIMILFVAAQLISLPPIHAQKLGASGLPLPRFVSLKAKRVNMRVGPGRDYKVQWLYVRKGLPMEIIQEFGNWRKVRDPNGNDGWILHSLLSGKRRAIVTPWDMSTVDGNGSLPTIHMFEEKSESSRRVAKIESGTLANVSECTIDWCKLRLTNAPSNTTLEGFVKQSLLWGVYRDEKIDN